MPTSATPPFRVASARLRAVPLSERATWAVEQLAVRPSDHLLEIGCGRGSAAWLVCSRLRSGRLLAIDRSPAAIKAARELNAQHVASGRAEFRLASIEELALGRQRFDKVYALNVNLFWARSSTVDSIRRMLKPAVSLCLFYEAPTAQRTRSLAERVTSVLSGQGWQGTTEHTSTRRGTAMVALILAPHAIVQHEEG